MSRRQTSLRRNITLRKTLLAALLFSFVTATPLLILNASGYRIDVRRWDVVRTGSIAITALPPGTEIHIGGVEHFTKQTSPLSPTVLFPGLLPGTYNATARNSDRQIWEKTIRVEEGRTTSFPFVRVFATTGVRIGKFSRTPRAILPHNEKPFVIGWDEQGFVGINLQDGKTTQALESILSGDVISADWLPDSTSLLSRLRNGVFILVHRATTPQPTILPLPTGLSTVTPISQDRFLALDTAQNLLLLNVSEASHARDLLAENVFTFAVSGSQAAYLDGRGALWALRGDRFTPRQRTVVSLDGASALTKLFLNDKDGAVAAITQDTTAWILWSDDERFSPIAEGISDASFSSDGTKLLLRGAHEISFVALEDRHDQPLRRKGARETILRLHEKIIRAALLSPEGEHVLSLASHTLRLTELDGRGGRNELAFPETAAFGFLPDRNEWIRVANDGSVELFTTPLPGLINRLGPQTPP